MDDFYAARTATSAALPWANIAPPFTSFAARGDVIRSILNDEGIVTESGSVSSGIAPEDLTTLAGEITVLVSCW